MVELVFLSSVFCSVLLGQVVGICFRERDHRHFSYSREGPLFGATWFLTALFQVSVIIHLAIRGFRKNKYGDFALLGMGAAVCALGFAIDFHIELAGRWYAHFSIYLDICIIKFTDSFGRKGKNCRGTRRRDSLYRNSNNPLSTPMRRLHMI